MEDVLELYAEPYDPEQPVVCFDEKSVQLLADVQDPLPLAPGQPIRQDYEYKRCGTANLFIALEPHTGERSVTVKWQFGVLQAREKLRRHYPKLKVNTP